MPESELVCGFHEDDIRELTNRLGGGTVPYQGVYDALRGDSGTGLSVVHALAIQERLPTKPLYDRNTMKSIQNAALKLIALLPAEKGLFKVGAEVLGLDCVGRQHREVFKPFLFQLRNIALIAEYYSKEKPEYVFDTNVPQGYFGDDFAFVKKSGKKGIAAFNCYIKVFAELYESLSGKPFSFSRKNPGAQKGGTRFVEYAMEVLNRDIKMLAQAPILTRADAAKMIYSEKNFQTACEAAEAELNRRNGRTPKRTRRNK